MPTNPAWKSIDSELPPNGAFVLHVYHGTRKPMYGMHDNGKFYDGGGPKKYPTTHWLEVPDIDEHTH